jgi:hypothetical protein
MERRPESFTRRSAARIRLGRTPNASYHRPARFGALSSPTACATLSPDRQEIGHPRSVVRPRGKVITVYTFHARAGSGRDIEATISDPGGL